jgi:thiamine transporter ThiT
LIWRRGKAEEGDAHALLVLIMLLYGKRTGELAGFLAGLVWLEIGLEMG